MTVNLFLLPGKLAHQMTPEEAAKQFRSLQKCFLCQKEVWSFPEGHRAPPNGQTAPSCVSCAAYVATKAKLLGAETGIGKLTEANTYEQFLDEPPNQATD